MTTATTTSRLDIVETTKSGTFDDSGLRIGRANYAQMSVLQTPLAERMVQILGVAEAADQDDRLSQGYQQ